MNLCSILTELVNKKTTKFLDDNRAAMLKDFDTEVNKAKAKSMSYFTINLTKYQGIPCKDEVGRTIYILDLDNFNALVCFYKEIADQNGLIMEQTAGKAPSVHGCQFLKFRSHKLNYLPLE